MFIKKIKIDLRKVFQFYEIFSRMVENYEIL